MTAPPVVLRSVRRLELYIRISAYVMLSGSVISPALIGAPIAARDRWIAVALVLMLSTYVFNVAVLHETFSAMLRGERLAALRRRRIWLPILISGLLGLVATVLARNSATGLAIAVAALLGLALALVPLLTWQRMLLSLPVVVLLSVPLALVVADLYTAIGGIVGFGFSVLFVIPTMWLSGWMLRVLSELDRLRQTAPMLAIAEERLRISRDLHDTFGRTLSVVAVKSELAAELARRGRAEQAADEIADVRRIAEEAGRDVRQVITGYHTPDLSREFDGARSVLESAGIGCEIDRSGPAPGAAAAMVLGWVVREAVTNVLRHSDATWCRLALTTAHGMTSLTVGNDGATAADAAAPGTGGTGLAGLADRVATAGGTLSHRRDGDRFEVTVSLPDVGTPTEPALTGRSVS